MKLKRIVILVLLLALASISCNLTKLIPSESSPASSGAPAVVPLASETASNSTSVEIIFISKPGMNSQITSPISVMGEADPTFEQNLVVLLTGEDGLQLAFSPTTIQSPLGSRGAFTVELNFSVASAQPGRISVYSSDAMIGAIEHLSSVEVELLPSGSVQMAQVESAVESIDILQPAASAQISGGSLQVSGFSDYYFESSLGIVLCGPGGGGAGAGVLVELCGSEDNILAAGSAMIQSADIGLPGPFSGQLSYSVSSPTPARLIVYATSARDGGLLHVDSVPIQLLP
jgi:hypothetical protein